MEVPAPLERIPLFVRAGTILPTWPVMQHTDVEAVDRLILHVYPGEGVNWLYEDDGHSLAYQQGKCRLTRFECRRPGETGLTIVRHAQGLYRPAYERWQWNIHGLTHVPQSVSADGQPVQNLAFDESSRVAQFESEEKQQIHVSM